MDSYHSDTDRTRSQSPTNDPTGNRTTGGMRIIHVLNDDHANDSTPSTTNNRPSRSRTTRDRMSTQRLIFKSKNEYTLDQPSPASLASLHEGNHHNHPRRSRPLTAHQIAVERNRQERIEFLLDRRLRRVYARCRKVRKQEGALWREWMRLEAVRNPSDGNGVDEGMQFSGSTNIIKDPSADNHHHPFRDVSSAGGGTVTTSMRVLMPSLEIDPNHDHDDYGEEFAAYTAAIRRTARRLNRWENEDNGGDAGIGGKQKNEVTTKKVPNGIKRPPPPPPPPPPPAAAAAAAASLPPPSAVNHNNRSDTRNKDSSSKSQKENKPKRISTRKVLSPTIRPTAALGDGGGGEGKEVDDDTDETELDDMVEKDLSATQMDVDTEEDEDIEGEEGGEEMDVD